MRDLQLGVLVTQAWITDAIGLEMVGRYTLEKGGTASFRPTTIECPFCGGMLMQANAPQSIRRIVRVLASEQRDDRRMDYFADVQQLPPGFVALGCLACSNGFTMPSLAPAAPPERQL